MERSLHENKTNVFKLQFILLYKITYIIFTLTAVKYDH
jgi:hypothetical protein